MAYTAAHVRREAASRLHCILTADHQMFLLLLLLGVCPAVVAAVPASAAHCAWGSQSNWVAVARQWAGLPLVGAAPAVAGDEAAKGVRTVELSLQLINLLLLLLSSLPGAHPARSIAAVGAAAVDAPCSERHRDAVRPVRLHHISFN